MHVSQKRAEDGRDVKKSMEEGVFDVVVGGGDVVVAALCCSCSIAIVGEK